MPVKKKAAYYSMMFKRRGMAVIFNHEKFDNRSLKQRNGTNVDCQNLRCTLTDLGFEVTAHNNLKCKEITKIIQQG
jgi:hypothetical protein